MDISVQFNASCFSYHHSSLDEALKSVVAENVVENISDKRSVASSITIADRKYQVKRISMYKCHYVSIDDNHEDNNTVMVTEDVEQDLSDESSSSSSITIKASKFFRKKVASVKEVVDMDAECSVVDVEESAAEIKYVHRDDSFKPSSSIKARLVNFLYSSYVLTSIIKKIKAPKCPSMSELAPSQANNDQSEIATGHLQEICHESPRKKKTFVRNIRRFIKRIVVRA